MRTKAQTAEVVYPTNVAIAEGIGVSSATITLWRREGMPNTSIAAAREWVQAHKPHIGKRVLPVTEELKLPIVALPESEDPDEVVKRLRLAERTIAAHIDAWLNVALPEITAERDRAKGKALTEAERKISVIHHKIEALRREQRMAVSALLSAESEAVKLNYARGKLVTIDDAKDLVTKIFLPIIIDIRKIPDIAETERERLRLSARVEACLEVLRQAAIDHVQKLLDEAYGPAAA